MTAMNHNLTNKITEQYIDGRIGKAIREEDDKIYAYFFYHIDHIRNTKIESSLHIVKIDDMGKFLIKLFCHNIDFFAFTFIFAYKSHKIDNPLWDDLVKYQCFDHNKRYHLNQVTTILLDNKEELELLIYEFMQWRLEKPKTYDIGYFVRMRKMT